MKQSIKYLIVFPKSRKSGVFYVNGNIQDGFYKPYEELYLFIADMLKPPTTIQVHELIYDHIPFYVDIKNNFAQALAFDSLDKIEQMKKDRHNNVTKDIMKLLSLQKNKNRKDATMEVTQTTLDTIMELVVSYDQELTDSKNNIVKRKGSNASKIINI